MPVDRQIVLNLLPQRIRMAEQQREAMISNIALKVLNLVAVMTKKTVVMTSPLIRVNASKEDLPMMICEANETKNKKTLI